MKKKSSTISWFTSNRHPTFISIFGWSSSTIDTWKSVAAGGQTSQIKSWTFSFHLYYNKKTSSFFLVCFDFIFFGEFNRSIERNLCWWHVWLLILLWTTSHLPLRISSIHPRISRNWLIIWLPCVLLWKVSMVVLMIMWVNEHVEIDFWCFLWDLITNY